MTRGMVQKLRAVVAFLEDQDLIPSTYKSQ